MELKRKITRVSCAHHTEIKVTAEVSLRREFFGSSCRFLAFPITKLLVVIKHGRSKLRKEPLNIVLSESIPAFEEANVTAVRRDHYAQVRVLGSFLLWNSYKKNALLNFTSSFTVRNPGNVPS